MATNNYIDVVFYTAFNRILYANNRKTQSDLSNELIESELISVLAKR